MTVRDYIISIASDLELGATLRTTCPICNGTDSFTISRRDEVLVHNCYKASCDKIQSSGVAYLDLSVEDRRRFFLERRAKGDKQGDVLEWTHPSYWIDGIGDGACMEYMKRTHMADAYKQGLFRPMYDPAERRFVFPIKNSQGTIIGAVGRSLVGAYPKVLNYTKKYLQPFTCGISEHAVVVEDCASAVAVTRGHYTGVALLGTHMRIDFIPHLAKYTSVGIALDADAYKKSFKMKEMLDTYLKNVYIIRLNKDIKDMEELCI